MSQVDRPEAVAKPEPFLTLRVIEGDAGTSVSCPELNVSMNIGGANKRKVSISAIRHAISNHANVLLQRQEAGTLPEETTTEQIDFARRIVEAEKDGFAVEYFINLDKRALIEISSDTLPGVDTGQN